MVYRNMLYFHRMSSCVHIYISFDLIDEDDLLALFLYPIIGLL